MLKQVSKGARYEPDARDVDVRGPAVGDGTVHALARASDARSGERDRRIDIQIVVVEDGFGHIVKLSLSWHAGWSAGRAKLRAHSAARLVCFADSLRERRE